MNYKELLELYKSEKLDDKQRKMVSDEIDKHAAISEYLITEENKGLFLELEDEEDSESGGSESQNLEKKHSETNNSKAKDNSSENDFVRLMKKSIRRSFVKAGVITGVILLIIFAFISFVVPKIIDSRYYDPTEIVGVVEENGLETNRISLDMSVYSELYMPSCYRFNVEAQKTGTANYNICILQNTGVATDNFIDVGGYISKDSMILYDRNLVKKLASNAFLPEIENLDCFFKSDYELKNNKEFLEMLEDNRNYMVYVTLDEVMDFADFYLWKQQNFINPHWCKLCFTKAGNSDNEKYYIAYDEIGFSMADSIWSHTLAFDEKKYPLLTPTAYYEGSHDEKKYKDLRDKDKVNSDMSTHVSSMLRYMSEQDKFLNLMRGITNANLSAVDFSALADNVEKNGVHVYGFTTITDKEEILKMKETEGIGYITVRDLKYE